MCSGTFLKGILVNSSSQVLLSVRPCLKCWVLAQAEESCMWRTSGLRAGQHCRSSSLSVDFWRPSGNNREGVCLQEALKATSYYVLQTWSLCAENHRSLRAGYVDKLTCFCAGETPALQKLFNPVFDFHYCWQDLIRYTKFSTFFFFLILLRYAHTRALGNFIPIQNCALSWD